MQFGNLAVCLEISEAPVEVGLERGDFWLLAGRGGKKGLESFNLFLNGLNLTLNLLKGDCLGCW